MTFPNLHKAISYEETKHSLFLKEIEKGEWMMELPRLTCEELKVDLPKYRGYDYGCRLQKEYKKKKFYLPPKIHGIATVPTINFLVVRGQGAPNTGGGAYKRPLEMLYDITFTIKM